MAELLRSALALSLAYWLSLVALVLAMAGVIALFVFHWGDDVDVDEGRER